MKKMRRVEDILKREEGALDVNIFSMEKG